MRTVFADTHYWIALANPRDEWHERAAQLSASLRPFFIVTTDEVLIELLAYFAGFGMEARNAAVLLVRRVLQNPNVHVIPQSHESFLSGLRLYESRLDKSYSLTDCVSMEAMRQHNLRDVLTHDDHFVQEGFAALIA